MADENEVTGITSHKHIFIDNDKLIGQLNSSRQQNLIDLFKQGAHSGMMPISPATDRTTMINDMQDDINHLKLAKDRKAQCLHMLTDLFFNRQKLTFEECQNLLGMIHSIDEENLVMAEIILKNKSYGSKETVQRDPNK